MTIYETFGLTPIINACGAATRLGGAPMPDAVLEAYCAAARDCVSLEELQATASRVIAKATGAEAGLVTGGASAALMLGAAAILARCDLAKIEKLPHCDWPCEFVVAREQRNGYDHAVRAAGAKLVEVGMHEIVAGAGVRRAETWEFVTAFGPQTAGVLYTYDANARPPLTELVRAVHAHGLPVLVDAAGELPPRSNLQSIVATGADLVAFSGGKAIRGPQATGILCGRRDLIASAALQMLDMDDHFELWEPPADFIDKSKLSGLPRHGIGRALKVSKEQIIALLTALESFASGKHLDELKSQRRRLDQIAAALNGLLVTCRIREPADAEDLPLLEIQIDEAQLAATAFELCRRLRRGKPSIQVNQSALHEGKLIINPLHLDDSRTAQLIDRMRFELTRRESHA